MGFGNASNTSLVLSVNSSGDGNALNSNKPLLRAALVSATNLTSQLKPSAKPSKENKQGVTNGKQSRDSSLPALKRARKTSRGKERDKAGRREIRWRGRGAFHSLRGASSHP